MKTIKIHNKDIPVSQEISTYIISQRVAYGTVGIVVGILAYTLVLFFNTKR